MLILAICKWVSMSAEHTTVNTPAAAWQWLSQNLSALDRDPARSATAAWNKFRSEFDGRRSLWSYVTDWPSDFWIAKTQEATIGSMVAVWSVPERLDQWPTLEVQGLPASTLPGRKTTSSKSMLDLLAGTEPATVSAESGPIRRYYALVQASTAHADAAMVSANQVRAWLLTAFGDLLVGVALTPVEDNIRGPLVEEVVRRIEIVDQFSGEQMRGAADYGCETLYNTRVTQEGFEKIRARQGQGEDWQNHWAWLSSPQDARAMLATIELVGRLLVNEPLLVGVASAICIDNENARMRALCVLRRWLLTAKVLAWAFEALQHDWTCVRPQDIACFAFGAMSPAWPRRAVALSHRSADAKPTLTTLNMWRSPHVAIDASYVPSRETNLGMIWSLFAPVPLIVRAESPTYADSEWCCREHEMLRYLVEHSDFIEGRAVADIGVEQLAALDLSLFVGRSERDNSASQKPFLVPEKEFPPFSMVLAGVVPLPLALVILRAAGALRLLNAFTQDPSATNQLASLLVAGARINAQEPTNNPQGWAAYAEIFKALVSAIGNETVKRSMIDRLLGRGSARALPLRVPGDYSPDGMREDIAGATQIPDLSAGQHQLADVLAAFEWRRTVFAWFMDEGFGDKAIVDVGESTAEEWTSQPRHSLARGLLALNGTTPMWIMQRAGQNAHLWPGVKQQPIFTRHVGGQFTWLKPVFLDPSWLAYYLANSGLEVQPALQAAMIAAIMQAAGPDALKFERQGDGVGLVIPHPRSVFMMPKDCLEDMFELMSTLSRDVSSG